MSIKDTKRKFTAVTSCRSNKIQKCPRIVISDRKLLLILGVSK